MKDITPEKIYNAALKFKKQSNKDCHLLFYFFVCVSACTNNKAVIIENHIGLYEIKNSKCDLSEKEENHCKSILFFELVKGQFIGIGNHELAYVFWSGDPKIDSELQYTSHAIRSNKPSLENTFWLNNDSDSEEYLIFKNGKLTEYHAAYATNNSTKIKRIHYQLEPVKRGNLPLVRMNYPGNK